MKKGHWAKSRIALFGLCCGKRTRRFNVRFYVYWYTFLSVSLPVCACVCVCVCVCIIAESITFSSIFESYKSIESFHFDFYISIYLSGLVCHMAKLWRLWSIRMFFFLNNQVFEVILQAYQVVGNNTIYLSL